MTATVSRLLLFTADADRVTDALAAITSTEPVTMQITRLDSARVTAHLVDVGATTIEIAPGEPAVPALIELQVADLPGVTGRLASAGMVVAPERGGVRVRIGALTVAVREAES